METWKKHSTHFSHRHRSCAAGFKGAINLNLTGSGGQSFGVFLAGGINVKLVGEANDYVGKGMAGGEIVIVPPADAGFVAESASIVGNTCLYGATGVSTARLLVAVALGGISVRQYLQASGVSWVRPALDSTGTPDGVCISSMKLKTKLQDILLNLHELSMLYLQAAACLLVAVLASDLLCATAARKLSLKALATIAVNT